MAVQYSPRQLEKINSIRRFRGDADADDVVEEALELYLEEQKLAHLREVIATADTRIAAGEVVVMTDSFTDDIRSNSKSRRDQGRRINPDVLP